LTVTATGGAREKVAIGKAIVDVNGRGGMRGERPRMRARMMFRADGAVAVFSRRGCEHLSLALLQYKLERRSP
jgi:hypothetical protein